MAAILNCPRMPIWHHPDFRSGYPYQLNSAKTFSIDAIARSSLVHAGLDRVLVGKYFNPDLVRSLHDRYSTDPTPTRLILDRFPSGLLHDLFSNIFDMSKIIGKEARVMPTKDYRPDHSRRSSSINRRPHDRV